MNFLRPLLLLTLVTGLLVSATSPAQEAGETATAPPIEFPALQQNWWNAFQGTPEEVGPLIESFLEQVGGQVADLEPQNQETALVIVEAVRDNLELYRSLLDDLTIQVRTPPPLSAMYSIDELLVVAATARDSRAAADADRAEVEREQRIFNGASRRRDAVFKDYADAANGDERWLAALRLVRARSALAIAGRRLELLTENASQSEVHAGLLAEQVELAQQRLANDVTIEDLATLVDEVNARAEAIAAAEELQREAQIGASGLDVDTALGRFEQRAAATTGTGCRCGARPGPGRTRPGRIPTLLGGTQARYRPGPVLDRGPGAGLERTGPEHRRRTPRLAATNRRRIARGAEY